LLVNPDLLRAFGGQGDVASASIKSADVGAKATTAADELSGSATQWDATLAGTFDGLF
jgi:hypothetical protein